MFAEIIIIMTKRKRKCYCSKDVSIAQSVTGLFGGMSGSGVVCAGLL